MNRRSRFEQLAECVPSFFLASDPGPSWRHSSPVTNPTTTLTATATRAACSTTAATTTTTSTYVAIASTSSASTYVAVASTSQGYASASTSLNCPTPSSSRAYLAPSPSASACRLQLSPASSKGYGTIARARGLLSPTPTFVTATPSDASFQHVRFTTHRYSPVDAAVASACSRSFSCSFPSYLSILFMYVYIFQIYLSFYLPPRNSEVAAAASAAQLARGLLRSTIKRQRFDAFVVLCDIAFMEAIELLARETVFSLDRKSYDRGCHKPLRKRLFFFFSFFFPFFWRQLFSHFVLAENSSFDEWPFA